MGSVLSNWQTCNNRKIVFYQLSLLNRAPIRIKEVRCMVAAQFITSVPTGFAVLLLQRIVHCLLIGRGLFFCLDGNGHYINRSLPAALVSVMPGSSASNCSAGVVGALQDAIITNMLVTTVDFMAAIYGCWRNKKDPG